MPTNLISPNQSDHRTLRVASVQMESLPGDKEANFRKIESFVEKAIREAVRLIVVPDHSTHGDANASAGRRPRDTVECLAEPAWQITVLSIRHPRRG